jgi:LCP family protein required for cell wall assembly
LRSQFGFRAFARRCRVAFVVTVVGTAAMVAGGYWSAARQVAKIPKVAIDRSVLRAGDNILLVGSDTRAFVDDPADAERFGDTQALSGQRSDTIMVAHVAGDSTFLVSFPRDLWVEIPGMGHAKINAAFNAGPQRLVETIQRNFEIPIAHYLQVDFAGFRNIVDAIGSIPLWFPTPARDTLSGLYVDEAGCVKADGNLALAFVRSRYYQSLRDGRWVYDPTSDLGRIARQQYFLRTVAREALGEARSAPWRAPKLFDTVLANLQRDPELGFGELRALAYAFHRRGAAMEALTVPTRPQTIEGQAALLLDEPKAAPLLARLRGRAARPAPGPPAGVAPRDVQVAVRNGSGRTGLGAQTLDALAREGFGAVAPATNADRSDYATSEVRYAPGAEDEARLVLAYLAGAGALAARPGGTDGVEVVVVIGRDFVAVRAPATAPPTTKVAAPRAPTSGGSNAVGSSAVGSATLPAAGC